MRLMLISDPRRPDCHNYLAENLAGHEIFFLWGYSKRSYDYEVKLCLPPGSHLLYWKDFLTPKKLIEQVKPDKILFLEIIDFWQIPLIIYAHYFGITTFFIEHGVGNSVEQVISRFKEVLPVPKRFFYYLKKLFSFPAVLHNRYFFLSVYKFLPKEQKSKYLKLPIYYKKYSPIEALSRLKFRNRTPHFAVLFNRNNIAPFLLYNDIERTNIITEGVPFFDKFYFSTSEEKNHIVFIDHPYLELNLLDWNLALHERIARTLESFAKQQKIKIIIKLHPRSHRSNWLRYNLDPNWIVIRQNEDVTVAMLSAKLILGYSSTLLNVMIACKKNTVLLAWHPKPKVFGDDFSKTGLCHLSLYPEDLFTRMAEWLSCNLAIANVNAFKTFIQEYNYPFDGKATNRLIDVITTREIN